MHLNDSINSFANHGQQQQSENNLYLATTTAATQLSQISTSIILGGGGVGGDGVVDDESKTITWAPTLTIPWGPTQGPAYKQGVYLGLTITFTVLYGLIFAAAFIQLILILYYRHKRFSYQSGFLFLCLFWSFFRIVLFSFYYQNADDANRLPFVFYFLLYCFPVVLQFSTICLLVLFYGTVYFKAATRPVLRRNSKILRICIVAGVFIFFATSVVCSYIPRELCILKSKIPNCNVYHITIIRVLVTDSLFVIYGIALGCFLFKLARLARVNIIMQQHGTTMCRAISVTILTAMLFITRTIYNLLAISIDKMKLPDFGFDWINVSDQADLVNLTEVKKYVTFVGVLFIWEMIPTIIILAHFRIKSMKNYQTSANRIPRFAKSHFLPSPNSQTINEDSFRDDERSSLLGRSRATTYTTTDDNSSINRYDATNEPVMRIYNENYMRDSSTSEDTSSSSSED